MMLLKVRWIQDITTYVWHRMPAAADAFIVAFIFVAIVVQSVACMLLPCQTSKSSKRILSSGTAVYYSSMFILSQYCYLVSCQASTAIPTLSQSNTSCRSSHSENVFFRVAIASRISACDTIRYMLFWIRLKLETDLWSFAQWRSRVLSSGFQGLQPGLTREHALRVVGQFSEIIVYLGYTSLNFCIACLDEIIEHHWFSL